MKYLQVLIVALMCTSFSLAQESVNQSDAQGRKQGVWTKKYENGQERYRGEFKDDKPVGTFFYYYEDGKKSSEVTYRSGDGTKADAKFFHKNGVIMGEGMYQNQKKHGEWRYYDDQSILSSIDHYDNGVLTDTSKVFFLNGQLAAVIPYKEGLKNGPFVEYFSDGKVRMQGTYQDNTYTGEYLQNYADGSPMIKGQYKAAVKDGLWIYYAEDGRVKAQQVWETGDLVKEKIEEGFEPQSVPIDIEEKDKIDEKELLDEYYKQNEQGK